MEFDGEMHITNRCKDNDQLVKHIRNTSSVNKSACGFVADMTRLRQLEQLVGTVPKLELKILSSGKLKGHVININA